MRSITVDTSMPKPNPLYIATYPRFILGVICPLVAALFQLALWQWIKPNVWFLFFPAVLLAGWIGGALAGLIATLISVLLALWFFIEPLYSLAIIDSSQAITMGLFIFMGLGTSAAQYRHGRMMIEMEKARHSARVELARFKTLFSQSPFGLAVIDSLSGHLVEVNPRFAELLGRSPAALLDVDWMCLTHPDDVQEDLNHMARMNAGLISGFQMEKRYLRPDGEVVWGNMTVAPLHEEDTSPRHLCMVEDITLRKQREMEYVAAQTQLARLESTQKLGGLVQQRLSPVFETDLKGRLRDANDLFLDELGIEREALIHFRLDDLAVRGDLLFAPEHLAQHAETIGHAPLECVFLGPRGTQVPFYLTMATLRSGEGQPTGYIGLAQNITLLKRAEYNFELAAKGAGIGVWHWDIASDRCEWSARPIDFFCGPDGSCSIHYGRDFFQMVHPEDRPHVEAEVSRSLAEGGDYRMEHRMLDRHGRLYWVQSMARTKFHAVEGHPIRMDGIIMDITGRKRAEDKLLEKDAHFKAAFEHLPVAYQSLDRNGAWICINQKMRDLIGADESQLLKGQSFFTYLDPNEADWLSYESGHHDQDEGFRECQLTRLDGRKLNLLIAYRIQRHEDGQFLKRHCIVFDVTPQSLVNRELQKDNQLLTSTILEKQKALDRAHRVKEHFLAGMGHEIRTPMNAVMGLAQILENSELTGDQREMAHMIHLSGRSLLHTINDIIDFSRMESGKLTLEPRLFNLAELLEQIHSFYGMSARAKGLKFYFESAIGASAIVAGDPQRIAQILNNLCSNAVKFTEKGSITFRITALEQSEDRFRVRFEITDTGIGVSEPIIGKIFHPFQQGQEGINRAYGGTGLGLAISHQLSEMMGGQLGCDSPEEGGSTFWFEVVLEKGPQEPVALSPREEKNDIPRLFGLKVLVVDDSVVNLHLAERALQREGAVTLTADNGLEALTLLQEKQAEIDVVLMDLHMPVMNGIEAVNHLRQTSFGQGIPVIALSGSSLDEDCQEALEAGMTDFLIKPIQLDHLVTLLQKYVR